MEHYFGTYRAFETTSKKDAAVLLGADNIVGDVYDIELELQDGTHKAWLVNRFNQKVAFFDPNFSRQLSIQRAGGHTLKAVLSFVAFTESTGYWGEMAVICYSPQHEAAFTRFIENVGKKMGEGKRLRVDLGAEAVRRVIESDGAWVPEQTVPLPKKKGTVIVKDSRSMNDKLIEQGRKGNVGCYALSWAFIIAVVAGVIFLVKMLLGL